MWKNAANSRLDPDKNDFRPATTGCKRNNTMKPNEIEAKSFSIIDEEAGDHGFSPDKWAVVRRMIHTTADFEYIQTVRFSPDALEAGISAIRAGRPVFTDTRMARQGIRQRDLDKFGGETVCLISDEAVAKTAVETGVTRAHAAVDAAASRLNGAVYAVGNAPTALLRLLELEKEGKITPGLVIGLPVGFVNAAESKAALAETTIPHITNLGRKGGSNVAAAVVNALILLALKKS